IGISRQAYYKRQQSETRQVERDARVCALVQHVRLRQPRMGTRKLQHVLRSPLAEAGIQVGRDRLFDILRAA
ncbi:IS3 family transposase, partial [Ralstonia solanacearum]|nr:IS3 family transposase [Ralstonia solanacearum]